MLDLDQTNAMGDKYPLGKLIVEGKTKKVYAVKNNSSLVVLVAKDDITAGDGAKHDVLLGKAILANETTCNVFRLLSEEGLPVAFLEQDSNTSFVAPACHMLPYEVVVRREADGSYLKRNPESRRGMVFPELLLEFHLKTSGKVWKGHTLPCDDPFMTYDRNGRVFKLYHPTEPMLNQEPFRVLPESEVFTVEDERDLICRMGDTAKQAFIILEKAWQKQGGRLVDYKVEFGLGPYGSGALLLADVIDADSCRVLDSDNRPLSKQGYRDGADLDSVLATYQLVAELTSRF